MTTPPPSPRRWWGLGALVISVLVISLDGTIINVALPTLSRELGASTTQLQWISGGYLLTFAAVMLPVGVLGDRFGHKRLLLAGIAVFGAASAVGVLADGPGPVIAVRALMGVGAAMIMPLTMAILPRMFARDELDKAVGTWTAAASIGMPVGPLVGGWLLNHFWWGSVFVFNLPVAVAALVAVAVLLPADPAPARRAGAGRRAPAFDGPGALLGALGITGLVQGSVLVPEDGWGSVEVLGTLGAGALLLAALVVRERRAAAPLVDLGLLGDRRFRWGAVVATFVNFCVMGILFVVPQYLGSVLGHSAFGTGLRLLPLIGGLVVGAQLAEAFVPRVGPRVVIPLGLLVLAGGTLLGARSTVADGYGFAALWLALTGAGFGLAIVPSTSMVLGSLPEEGAGAGSSLLETLQQVGGVLGVAGLGSLLSSGYLDRLSTGGLPDEAARAARDSVTGANAVAAQLDDPGLLASAHAAFVHGSNLVLTACGLVALVAALLAAAFVPPRSAFPAKPAGRGRGGTGERERAEKQPPGERLPEKALDGTG
ncbi:MFS transporter [Kitasatospora sp. NPDC056184]|uniref:MFS transporter n=1 Tax=Kitasatospora sp. NPDC056184 TaxID=3345738 RepID=UPI0035D80CB5